MPRANGLCTKASRGATYASNDVLGAYAIDQDAMGSFIVADFDAKSEKANEGPLEDIRESVATFLQVSEKFSVPVYLERSRSGQGFHIWLFFENPVAAKDARLLFSALLTAAMEENAKIGFDSYDRFVPHQDTIPSTGFGNLIALPLQGRAGKQGNSVFLDGRFRPFPDQWEFLSCVKRLSPSELQSALVRVSGKDGLGELADDALEDPSTKPWEKKRPELPLTRQDVTETLTIVEANMLHLEKEQLGMRAYSRLKRLAAFRNLGRHHLRPR